MALSTPRAFRAALAAGVVVLGVLPPVPATAIPSPIQDPSTDRHVMSSTDELIAAAVITPEELALMSRQDTLSTHVEAIRERAREADGVETGIGGVVVSPEINKITLYWRGDVTPGVDQALRDARAAGIKIVLAPATYTEATLDAEMAKMAASPLFRTDPIGRRVMKLAAKADGSGIDVGLSGVPDNPNQIRDVVPALDSTDVPLSISVMDEPQFTSRWFDSDPWWGGGFVQRFVDGADAEACTNAFGVTGNNGAANYLLTAAHCGPGEFRTGSLQYHDGTVAQRTFGSTISTRAPQHDAELIHTPDGTEARVYHGAGINPPANSVGSSDGLIVGGTSANNIGDLICTSGSYTGTVCGGIRVTAVNVRFSVDPPVHGVGGLTGLINAQLPDVAIAGSGDSGGPVYSIRTVGDQSKALARGVISAVDSGSYSRPCQGFDYPGRSCSMSVYFGDIRTITDALGVRVNTG